MASTGVSEDELTPAEELRDLLETLLEAMDLDGEVVIGETDDALVGTVEGDDLGRFIGRHGQTIEAVQHLAQRIVLRGGGGPRVIVDAAGYRARREATLRAQADEAAEAAVRTGRAVELEPMSSAERRFVHEYLRERGGVETHSEGDEPERRLVVAPPGS
ncbi:MAG TPA: R3H domain-containing nucleic acid-binding protein [Solirubrobacteraceae bacterium]|nr:R3H domain-containing nucleic acid-binding protein [Solirubrobacteraceae bacterium]